MGVIVPFGQISEHLGGGRVVLSTGVFDLLHLGHIALLNRAKDLGDKLWVGINSDASVKGVKGQDRPIQGATERAYILSHLNMIDYVVIFDEYNPVNLINHLVPDLFVKGWDYLFQNTPELDVLKHLSIPVVYVPLVYNSSTTFTINKIRG